MNNKVKTFFIVSIAVVAFFSMSIAQASATYIPPVNQNLPVATTIDASAITQTSALLNGYVISTNQAPTTVWFEWGPTLGLGYSTPHQNLGYTSTFGDVVENLQPETRYFYRAVAQNSIGTSVGATYFFTTADVAPQIIYINTHTQGNRQTVAIKTESNYAYVCESGTNCSGSVVIADDSNCWPLVIVLVLIILILATILTRRI
ncbi:MAG: hypothetical protein RL641_934 [Candidatus Parcubacteria bacterium]|jgi:hypothetical protein